MWFGTDAEEANRFVLGLMSWMLDGLDEAGRALALDSLGATLAAHDTGAGVFYGLATWITDATRV
jgi:hypothetical protein